MSPSGAVFGQAGFNDCDRQLNVPISSIFQTKVYLSFLASNLSWKLVCLSLIILALQFLVLIHGIDAN